MPEMGRHCNRLSNRKTYRMQMSTVSTIVMATDLQKNEVNRPFHRLNLEQQPPRQGEQQAGPECGAQEMPGCLELSEIHEDSGADDPAEGDEDQGIEPGVAHKPNGGADSVAVLGEQLKCFHWPATGFSRANHREEVAREKSRTGLERIGNGSP
jgi:hypothetical protein